MVLDLYPNGFWAGSLVIGGYPSPLVDECYLTVKLSLGKMNFSYSIPALNLVQVIGKKLGFMQIYSISLPLVNPCMH